MLKIENLYVDELLENINVSFQKGKITTIIGENGVGKSTLAKSIANINDYKGNITLDEDLKFNTGYIFQNPDNQFVRNIVIDDIAFSLESLNLPKKQMEDKISLIATEFGIEDLLYNFTSELSGGEKQKVAIVANLVLNPKVLILDESFEMIDEKSTQSIKDLLIKYVKNNNIVCIQISHDINIIDISDKVVIIEEKKITFDDSLEEFYKNTDLLKKFKIEVPLYKKISESLNLDMSTDEQMKRVLCKLNSKI